MFIKISDKNDLLEKLNKHKDSEVVIHYNCSDCDDEQVTYSEDAESIEEAIKTHGYLVPHINCTNCGAHTGILDIDYIQGIEPINKNECNLQKYLITFRDRKTGVVKREVTIEYDKDVVKDKPSVLVLAAIEKLREGGDFNTKNTSWSFREF